MVRGDAVRRRIRAVTGPSQLLIRVDDLSGPPTRALVARHLDGMYADSPPESVHALGIERLRDPAITFWSAWLDGVIAGCGALKDLGDGDGEIKSMRVADTFLGRGVGRAVLRHIVAAARARGMRRLWLETGSTPSYTPALALYASEGFERCGPFGDYRPDPFSIFMTRDLADGPGGRVAPTDRDGARRT